MNGGKVVQMTDLRGLTKEEELQIVESIRSAEPMTLEQYIEKYGE